MLTSGRRLKSAGGVSRRTKNINYSFWSYLQIFRSDSKLSHLDQQSERLDIQIFKLIRILNYTVKGTGIEISDWKESCMSGTHVSKQGVLSCTLSLSIICGKSLSWNSFSISYSILQKHNEATLNIYTANNPLLFLSIMLMYLNLLSFCGDPPLRMSN